VSRLAPLEPHDLDYDKPLCASLDGFTLHAATRAGAFHPGGREALLRYVLRPPIAQERLAGYRPWAELLARTFAVDVLACPKCHGRMRLLAMVEEPANVARFLAAMGEPTELPRRSPGRGPPYWKSRVLRRQALGDEDDAQGRWVQETA
jgi:uncharacterized protein YbaR (Trm112 family)